LYKDFLVLYAGGCWCQGCGRTPYNHRSRARARSVWSGSGAAPRTTDAAEMAATLAVELEASRRDPCRQLSRVFHLVGRKLPG